MTPAPIDLVEVPGISPRLCLLACAPSSSSWGMTVHEKKTSIPGPITGAVPSIGKASQPAIVAVPWDAQALKGRECVTCACFFEQANPENPLQSQGFCRRLPADMAKMRGLEERRDNLGNVVMKDGKPVMQPAEIVGYIFKPTKREGTCFDGWRPQGTLPGDTPVQGAIRAMRSHLEPLLEQVPESMRPFIKAIFGIDTVDIPTGTQN